MARHKWVIRLFAVLGLVSGTSVLAVELTQATNQQILDELGRRLGGGSGPGPFPAASASFICDSRSALVVTLAGRDTSSSVTVDTNGSNNCLSQADLLVRHRSHISTTAIIGICDSNWSLNRISLNPSGMATKIGVTPMNGSSQCLAAESQMNSTLISDIAE